MSVVSVRVDKKAKRTLEEAGVDITAAIKKMIEEMAWDIERKKRVERLNRLTAKLAPAERGFATKSVREDRDGN